MENKELKNIFSYKVKQCLQCNAITDPKDEKEFYCSQCGAPILNRCSNYDCQEILDEKARFCKYCGSPSIFKNYGLLDKVTSSPINEDDLPF